MPNNMSKLTKGPDALNWFWFRLARELSSPHGMSCVRRTDRSADIGYGCGYRMLICDRPDGRGLNVSNPHTGVFQHLPESDEEVRALADDVKRAFRLSRRQREVLDAIRDGRAETVWHGATYRLSIGGILVNRPILDKLSLIGVITEDGNDWVAIQPESVHR